MVSRNRDGREDVLAAFQSRGSRHEPQATEAVADALGCSERVAAERLERLVEEGVLRTKEIGTDHRVWWRPGTDGTTTGRDRDRLFRSLVEATAEYAIFMLDPDGHVLSWNAGAERIKGYAEDDIVGEHFSAFYTEADASAGVPEDNLSAAIEQGSVEDEGWRVREDGSRFWANVTITALREDGELRGFAKVTRDMTERRELEQRLRAERNRFERALDAVPSSIGVLSADGEFVLTNEAVDGVAIEELGADGTASDARSVFDEDGEWVPPAERPHVSALETGSGVTDWRCQVDRPDYGRRWLSVSAMPISDDEGAVEEVVVCGDDVTQLKEQAERLRAQRDDLESELDDVFERVSNAFIGLDDEWRFTYVNERAAAVLERDETDLLGASLWDEFAQFAGTPFDEKFHEAMATQRPVHFEARYPPRDAWFEVQAYPSETGLSVYFDDVSERKERERELERYERIVENVPAGVYRNTPGPDGEFVEGNPQLASIFDAASVDELLGTPVSELYPDPEQRAAFSERLERNGVVEDYELRQETLDGRPIWISVTAVRTEEDGQVYFDGVVQDVTERKERERERELFERMLQALHESSRELIRSQEKTAVSEVVVEAATSVLDLPGVVVYRRDDEADALILDEQSVDAGFMREALPDFPVDHSSVVGHTYCDGEANYYADVLDSEHLLAAPDEVDMTAGLFVPLGDHGVLAVGWPEADACDERTRTLIEILAANAEAAYGRVERDRELEARARQQEVVADLGQRALGTDDLAALFEEAVELVAETLDSEYCKVLDLDRRSERLELRAGVGLPAEQVGSAAVDVGRESQAGYTLIADEPIVVEDMAEEKRFDGPDRLMGSDVESGISVVVGSRASPWGVLTAHDTDSREFSDDDALFVQSVANILANAIDRRDREAELEDQREHLAALNNLNTVVRDINEAVVEQSTREAIERTVCERLADSESYRFAWTAEVDPRTGSLEPRVEAGVDGYLEAAGVHVDEDRPAGRGPVGRAARSKRIHVTHDAPSDPTIAPWNDAIETYGFRSCAAIPIVHQGTLYGILGVYTDRVGAFADEEEEVVAQLGEIMGHAIAGVDRKQALMSDDVVEIDVRIDDILREAGLSEPMAGRITLTRTVSLGDGDFLQYGTATDGAIGTVESLADGLSHWDELTRLGGDDDETRFELRLSEPPVVSTVADNGGYVDEAVVENETMHITVHLPPTVDVRRVVDTIQESYDTAEMVTRQQVSRTDSRRGIDRALTAELTDRQRAALEASYYGGFFEWPRESSGEEVAASLDVSAPTFHQHLRKAQRKVLGAILE